MVSITQTSGQGTYILPIPVFLLPSIYRKHLRSKETTLSHLTMYKTGVIRLPVSRFASGVDEANFMATCDAIERMYSNGNSRKSSNDSHCTMAVSDHIREVAALRREIRGLKDEITALRAAQEKERHEKERILNTRPAMHSRTPSQSSMVYSATAAVLKAYGVSLSRSTSSAQLSVMDTPPPVPAAKIDQDQLAPAVEPPNIRRTSEETLHEEKSAKGLKRFMSLSSKISLTGPKTSSLRRRATNMKRTLGARLRHLM
ncbi:hypothetical protein DFJ77DRAFT_310733 [Powellomyces hirtus]|nr:hypothetical protein DFJ77DRAFT_310733 [Powellomyces hirtus]